FSPLPGLSLPARFPRWQVTSLAVVVSLIVTVPSRSVTAPPGLMVQVAAAAAGPAARPTTRQAAMPVSRVRAEREKGIHRMKRASGGRPDPSRPWLTPAAALIQASWAGRALTPAVDTAKATGPTAKWLTSAGRPASATA